jgi:hypothetical protein
MNLTQSPQKKKDGIPILTLGILGYFLLNHIDHDIITDKSPRVHDLLGSLPQGRLLSHLRTKHIPRRQMANTILVLDFKRLGALSYADSQQR